MRPENRVISKARKKVEIAQRAAGDAADLYRDEDENDPDDQVIEAFRTLEEAIAQTLEAIDTVIERYEADFI
jgi:K+/H+ antiporter YhaU regulatory subunit KhtT